MDFPALDRPTCIASLALTALWLAFLVLRPRAAASARLAITLNLVSAMLFFLYVTEDPDLTSSKSYADLPVVRAISGRAVGAAFLASMAGLYIWLGWTMTGPCLPPPLH